MANGFDEAMPFPASRAGDDARFWLLADHAPVLLWMSGLDGLCDFFNSTWLQSLDLVSILAQQLEAHVVVERDGGTCSRHTFEEESA